MNKRLMYAGILIILSIAITAGMLTAAAPQNGKINMTLHSPEQNSVSSISKANTATVKKYGSSQGSQSTLVTRITTSPENEFIKVTGDFQLVIPGTGSYQFTIADHEYLNVAEVDGKIIYHGPISGSVKTKQGNEPFAIQMFYNLTDGTALVTVATGTVGDLSLLAFGDITLMEVANTIYQGDINNE